MASSDKQPKSKRGDAPPSAAGSSPGGSARKSGDAPKSKGAAPKSKAKRRAESDPPSSRGGDSLPPPSQVPGTSSAGMWIAGMVAMGGLILGLVMWNRSQNAPPPAPSSVAPVATATASTMAAKLPEYAPPAPPPPEVPSATASAGASAGPNRTAGSAPGGGAGPCEGCGSGISSNELNSAVRSAAGSAQGCYNRGLQGSESEGGITVSVSVGANGSVCSANAVSDTLGNPGITSCVLSKFRGASFPRPKQGCVVVQVPISFKVKR